MKYDEEEEMKSYLKIINELTSAMITKLDSLDRQRDKDDDNWIEVLDKFCKLCVHNGNCAFDADDNLLEPCRSCIEGHRFENWQCETPA